MKINEESRGSKHSVAKWRHALPNRKILTTVKAGTTRSIATRCTADKNLSNRPSTAIMPDDGRVAGCRHPLRFAPVNIHPLAIVSPEAQIGRDVSIGPFSVIESDVVIGDRCRLASHVVVKSGTRLGPDNEIYESAVLGGLPQHIHKPERPGLLVLGSGNTIREQVTLHRAMKEGSATVLGDNNFLMATAHVAHDCQLGNNIIMANAVLLAGHVTVDDRAFLSGGVGRASILPHRAAGDDRRPRQGGAGRAALCDGR